jgi:hypothetical protein
VRPSAAALKKLFRIALRLKRQIVAAPASPRPKSQPNRYLPRSPDTTWLGIMRAIVTPDSYFSPSFLVPGNVR